MPSDPLLYGFGALGQRLEHIGIDPRGHAVIFHGLAYEVTDLLRFFGECFPYYYLVVVVIHVL